MSLLQKITAVLEPAKPLRERNMSYCRFQNTRTDLADCVANWDDGDLSPEEIAARAEIFELAKEIVSDLSAGNDGDLETQGGPAPTGAQLLSIVKEFEREFQVKGKVEQTGGEPPIAVAFASPAEAKLFLDFVVDQWEFQGFRLGKAQEGENPAAVLCELAG